MSWKTPRQWLRHPENALIVMLAEAHWGRNANPYPYYGQSIPSPLWWKWSSIINLPSRYLACTLEGGPEWLHRSSICWVGQPWWEEVLCYWTSPYEATDSVIKNLFDEVRLVLSDKAEVLPLRMQKVQGDLGAQNFPPCLCLPKWFFPIFQCPKVCPLLFLLHLA